MKAEAAENKKKRLETRYGISMTDGFDREVNSMCNLSELVEERGIKKGRAEGLAEGLAQGLQDMVYSLHDANVPLEQIYTIVKGRKNYANVTEKEILSLYQSAMQNGRHN
jgi:flagellar biosynthesis/type III secretory pathway protein FliH